MANLRKNPTELMEETVKTAKIIGVDKTVEFLRQLRKVESSSIIKAKREIIVNEVLIEFRLSMAMIRGAGRDTKYARMFCFVLLKKHLYMDALEIGHIFDRSKQRVYEEQSAFNRLNPKFSQEADLIKRYNNLERVILEKIS